MSQDIDIIKLDFPDNIRLRPGMIIGSVDNPSVLLREIIDNSIDELYGHQGTDRIIIETSETLEQWNIVMDNGRGIPILWDEEHEMTKVRLAFTSLHAGSKFNKTNVAVGMNGVGGSAVSALSNDFVILSKITKDNYDKSIPAVKEKYSQNPDQESFYFLRLNKGLIVSETACSLSEINEILNTDLPSGFSTIVLFKPDDTIFNSILCKIPKKNLIYVMSIMEKIYHRRVEILVNGVNLLNEFKPYKYEYIKEVTNGDRSAKFYINFEVDKDLSQSDYSGSINSLVVNRGLHIESATSAYSQALKSVYQIPGSKVLYGIHINCICICTEMDFSSQTKERCTKIEKFKSDYIIKELVPEFIRVIKSNKEYFDVHVMRLKEYLQSLTKISTINKIKNTISTVGGNKNRVRSKLPKSVRDAANKNRKNCELLICEGMSAAASILNTRDNKTQAVFTLRGVPMNAINRSLDDILENEEMNNLITAIGVGVNEYHNLKMARYGRIIIAADADSDGQKISSLVLGMIASKMTFLIEQGMVYVVISPLYIQNGEFIYPNDVDKLDRSKPYTRIKGLGELSDSQAYTALTNKATRKLLQITSENLSEALSLLTTTGSRKQLMIDQGVIQDPYELGLWY